MVNQQINIKKFDPYFYKNCKRNRKVNAKICQVCPFKAEIERQESLVNNTPKEITDPITSINAQIELKQYNHKLLMGEILELMDKKQQLINEMGKQNVQ